MTKKISKPKTTPPKKSHSWILRSIVSSWPILLLILISSLLCFLNFDSRTFLTGWDNLHPEFNPQLNLQRAFLSVWQEYQSTGLLGGMAHAADLPRILLIYLLSLPQIIPLNYFRYASTFLPLILGPLGVYFLLHKIIFRKDLDAKTSEIASLLGSLFYLLNLGTLQNFFTPFEPFAFFYGALPWLLYLIISYQIKPKTRTLIFLFLVSLASTTSYYVETIFISFGFCFLSFVIDTISEKEKLGKSIKSLLASFSTILFANIFWLLPVIFFVVTNGHVSELAKVNQIATPETYYRNLEFGNLAELLKLKGFWFQFLDQGLNSKFELLLNPWINHLNSPFIKAIGIIFPVLFLIGLYYAFQKKFPYSKTFGLILGICYFFLLGGGLLINNSIPFIGELFRSPFTKFIVPLTLSYSYFFAIGVIFLLDIFAFLDTKLTYNLTLFTTILLLVIYMSPAFSGNLISKSMRVDIPTEYFDLFNYLKTKPSTERIANFPQHTFWGWNYYSWGYRGSGFLWYGIKQPILDRAFDVWEKTSENYYQELSTALFSQKDEDFDEVIDKYNVSYLLVDKSVLPPETKGDLGMNYLLENLEDSSKYSLEKSFGDNLLLYKNTTQKSKNFLSLTDKNKKDSSEVLSFSLRPNQNWYEKAEFLNTNLNIPCNEATGNCDQKSLEIPSLSDTEKLLPYQVAYKKIGSNLSIRFTPITPVLFVNKEQFDIKAKSQTVEIPISPNIQKLIININSQYFPFELPSEITDFSSYYQITEIYLPTSENFDFGLYNGLPTEQLPLTNSLANANPSQCYTNKANRKIEKILSPRSVTLLGTDLVACLSTTIPDISIDKLLSVSFTYYSPTLTTANVNITDENYGTLNTYQPLDPSNTPKRAEIFTKPSKENKQINLILESAETKSIQEITYKDVYLSTHDPLYETEIALSKIPALSIPLTNKDNSLQVSLPLTKTQYDINQTAASNALFPEDKNCDKFNKGETVKQVNSDHILYQSRDAIECDFLNLRNFDHSLNYLIGFTAQKTKGLSLTTCLENHTTRRCDVYERLTNTKTTQYLIQPITNDKESPGYTLHLFNQSLGNRITENKLSALSIHPFPLTFLKNITVKNNEPKKDQGLEAKISTTHPAEFLYTASVFSKQSIDKDQSPPSLNLYQTSSPYWKAIVVPESYLNQNPWQLTLNILLNYSTLPKLETANNNSWHNSWQLPKEKEGLNLVIIYLPQYLELLGFTLLIIFSAILFTGALSKQLGKK